MMDTLNLAPVQGLVRFMDPGIHNLQHVKVTKLICFLSVSSYCFQFYSILFKCQWFMTASNYKVHIIWLSNLQSHVDDWRKYLLVMQCTINHHQWLIEDTLRTLWPISHAMKDIQKMDQRSGYVRQRENGIWNISSVGLVIISIFCEHMNMNTPMKVWTNWILWRIKWKYMFFLLAAKW